MEMYEEISSDICKGSYDQYINKAITRIENGFDVDDAIEETIDNIINDHFEYLREHIYKYIHHYVNY